MILLYDKLVSLYIKNINIYVAHLIDINYCRRVQFLSGFSVSLFERNEYNQSEYMLQNFRLFCFG